MTEIFKTQDYDAFKTLDDNRKVLEKHVSVLKRSIETDNMLHLNPIIVTENLEVIDGQHRLHAAKALNVPIFYVIDNNFNPEKLVKLNNTQKAWNLIDYLNFYVNQGKENYIQFKYLITKYKLAIFSGLEWFAVSNSRDFKSGDLEICFPGAKEKALIATLDLIDAIEDLGHNAKIFQKQTSFHRACLQVFYLCKVDAYNLITNMKKHGLKLPYSTDMNFLVEGLINIYNFNKKTDRYNLLKLKKGYKIIKEQSN